MSVLGDLLREKRAALGLTLDAVVARCESEHRPSRGYVLKLERGEVKSPSPFILHELSHALSIPYPTIMEAAGYIYPQGHFPPRPGLVVDALLAGGDLSGEERERLADLFVRLARAIRETPAGLVGDSTPEINPERPPEHVFEEFREMHGAGDSTPGETTEPVVKDDRNKN